MAEEQDPLQNMNDYARGRFNEIAPHIDVSMCKSKKHQIAYVLRSLPQEDKLLEIMAALAYISIRNTLTDGDFSKITLLAPETMKKQEEACREAHHKLRMLSTHVPTEDTVTYEDALYYIKVQNTILLYDITKTQLN